MGSRKTTVKERASRAVQCHCGDHCYMKLNKGYVTIFDPLDADLTQTGAFWAAVRPHGVYVLHRKITDGVKQDFRFHREIMNVSSPDVEVDHINCNGLDNRKRKLRVATRAQNSSNRRFAKNSSSKYLGVWFYSKGATPRWIATIQSKGESVTIGRFTAEIDAALAYDAMATELHGEFARLNFPKEKTASG